MQNSTDEVEAVKVWSQHDLNDFREVAAVGHGLEKREENFTKKSQPHFEHCQMTKVKEIFRISTIILK